MIDIYVKTVWTCNQCGEHTTNMEKLDEPDDAPSFKRPPGWATVGSEDGEKELCPICLTAIKYTVDQEACGADDQEVESAP